MHGPSLWRYCFNPDLPTFSLVKMPEMLAIIAIMFSLTERFLMP